MIAAIENVIENVEEAVCGTEVSNILDKFPADTLPENAERTLVREGLVQCKTADNVRFAGKMYLFNDYMLVVDGVEVKNVISVEAMGCECGRSHIRVQVDGELKLSFKAADAAEQKEWIKALKVKKTMFNKVNIKFGKSMANFKGAVDAVEDAVEDAVAEAKELVGETMESNSDEVADIDAASLRDAADKDMLKTVEYLVHAGVNVNGRDENGNTALHLTNMREIAELLLQSGARQLVNNRGVAAGSQFDDLPSTRAATNICCAKECVDKEMWKSDEGKTCQLCDVEFGVVFPRRHHCRACGDLVCDDCSLNTFSATEEVLASTHRMCDVCFNKAAAPTEGRASLVESVIDDAVENAGITDAVEALGKDAPENLEEAEKTMAKVKATILKKLVKNKLTKSVKKLYKSFKTTVEEVDDAMEQVMGDVVGDTVDAVKDMAENVMDKHEEAAEPALRMAAKQDSLTAVEACVRKGVNVNARDEEGNTALHLCSDIEVARFLVASGARFLVNKEGEEAGAKFEGLELRTPTNVESEKEACDEADWVADEESDACRLCEAEFGFVTRKHHCRACGELCCADCSANTFNEKRACDKCFNEMAAAVEKKEEEPVEQSLMDKVAEVAEKIEEAAEAVVEEEVEVSRRTSTAA